MSMTSDPYAAGQTGSPDSNNLIDSLSPMDVPGPARFSGRQLRELVADDAWLTS